VILKNVILVIKLKLDNQDDRGVYER